jgi:hypothetical protein
LTIAYYIQHHTPVPKSSKSHPNTSTPEPQSISRRQFARKAALVAAASISAPALLPGSEPIARPAAQPNASPQEQKAPPLKGLTPEQTADVDAKLANILRKYGSRFDDDQKKHLRRILAQQQRLLAPVREFAVKNGDPPASVLRLNFDKPTPQKANE